MERSLVTKLLNLFHLISQLLCTASNQLKYKCMIYLRKIYTTLKSVTYLNEGTCTGTSSVQDLPIILK